MRLVATLLLCGALGASSQRSDLRRRVAAACEGGVSVTELNQLSQTGFEEAERAQSRSGLWNALTQIALLVQHAPPESARAVRRRALELLAEHDSDTLRWSSLLTTAFHPSLESLEQLAPSAREAELARYDRLLIDLAQRSEKERVRAELFWARIQARLTIDRHRAWLSVATREETLRWVARFEREHGTTSVPGVPAGSNQASTQRDRADAARRELTDLAFGALAPGTAGIDLESNPLNVNELRGKIVVLDFWTSFCQPCLALVPAANHLLEELRGEPIVYLGVCGDEERSAGAATARRVGMNWRNLWDETGAVARTWRVADVGWPSVFVLDAEGRIRAKLRGRERIERELAGVLRELLAEER